MTDTTDIGPLDWRIGIVDQAGRPTPEFQRRWNTQRGNNSLIGTITTGSGAPTGTPSEGQVYIDTSATPWTFYAGHNGSWEKVGVYTFVQLSDVPNSYTGAGGKLVGVNSGATGLDFITPTSVLDSIGGTQGDILYRNSTQWTTLAPGTSGQVLSTGGASANPSWMTPSSGGDMTKIGSVTASGSVNSVSFSSIPSTYSNLIVMGYGRTAASGTGADSALITFNGDTGANYANANWYAGTASGQAAGTGNNLFGGQFTQAGDPTNVPGTINCFIQGYSNTTFAKTVNTLFGVSSGSTLATQFVIITGGVWNNTSAISSLTITTGSGANYVAGSHFDLYALK